MNLVWKGIYKSVDQLPKGDLPERAVKFKEPDNLVQLNIIASLFVIPVLILIAIAVFLKFVIAGGEVTFTVFNLWGFLLAFLMILPHEMLHAMLFPKGKEVELWVSPKAMAAFVVCTAPISKGRFIFLSLLPNIVFGFIPLVVWIVLPVGGAIENILFSFATLSLLFGVGDYLNVFNAARQMPNGALTQLSGMNSYWFMPEEEQKAQ
ncbi:DUF3267 domain-containing protein [Evansella cellulosilytica]|uniref:DUF3267 domain-containing protein n=1 Tax=Evansella cellulosilytica (strain ATCC 21833 / DSM 2522 / FERM P-1141 / JCM 9156 / N-4) TaxID=649639 RepID=E6TYC5_EVAC2|nr:DUF3267 domain-containing protein [Evansella cellulosilytica]ADU28863.1 hypothetical protein Bcell_0581 [Evansella cellulosilytica DSM 2522]